MKLKLAADSREFEVELLGRDGPAIRARIDGVEFRANVDPASGALSRIHDKQGRALAARVRDSLLVTVGPLHFAFVVAESRGRHGFRGLAAPEVLAPMPGKVLKLLVQEGETVESGAPLLVLEAMKMETTLYAESPATIGKVRASAGEMVDHGAVLIELKPAPPTTDPSPTESAPPAR